ncbi:hypothetical protein B0H63DRAFT_516313 [Podospora didyma]|uniref:Uncharacterized protein n=1 Tax=Podospora didyma TaxID=330526 RepID=A0AAE0P4K5_9PEZI|nr:hypothetical protein B0H63DRAFT_516313 [Podospora didyma]
MPPTLAQRLSNPQRRDLDKLHAPIDIDNYLPIQLRSPRGGGGSGGGGSSGGGGGGRGGGSGRTGSGSDFAGSDKDEGSGSSSSSSGSTTTPKTGSSSGSTSGSGTSSTGTSSTGTKGGSTGTSTRPGTPVIFINNGNHGYGPNGNLAIPIWAIVLITILSTLIILFFGALAYHYIKERKRPGPVRHGRVWWKAVKVASFIWIPILLWKCICGRRNKKDHNGNSRSIAGPDATYTKIDEGGDANSQYYGYNNAAPPAAAAAAASTTTAYGEGGVGYLPTVDKYEPYASTMTTLSAPSIAPSALSTPAVGYAAPTVSSMSRASTPEPTTGAVGNNNGAGTGAAQDYYSQHPLVSGSGHP